MEPILRPATQSNIDLIVDFSRLNQEDPTFTGEFRFDETAIRTALTQLLTDPTLGQAWLIQVDDRPVGYVVLAYGFSQESHGRDALIDEIYVMPDYRRHGISRRVLKQMEAEAGNLSATRIYLEVERTNGRAQTFTGNLGLRITTDF